MSNGKRSHSTARDAAPHGHQALERVHGGSRNRNVTDNLRNGTPPVEQLIYIERYMGGQICKHNLFRKN
jgi:hypothetical protein